MNHKDSRDPQTIKYPYEIILLSAIIAPPPHKAIQTPTSPTPPAPLALAVKKV